MDRGGPRISRHRMISANRCREGTLGRRCAEALPRPPVTSGAESNSEVGEGRGEEVGKGEGADPKLKERIHFLANKNPAALLYVLNKNAPTQTEKSDSPRQHVSRDAQFGEIWLGYLSDQLRRPEKIDPQVPESSLGVGYDPKSQRGWASCGAQIPPGSRNWLSDQRRWLRDRATG